MFTIEEARSLLVKAGVFFSDDPEENCYQTLNMNDTWGWAVAMGEKVADEDLIRVAQLFWHYGWCGLVYWVSERHDHMKSEFHDVNRHVEFVRQEEQIRKDLPDPSDRAYAERSYTLGK